MRDRHGNLVDVGDIVRVLEIAPEIIESLADDERPHIQSMLNEEYEIDDLPEEGKVSVSISWRNAKDTPRTEVCTCSRMNSSLCAKEGRMAPNLSVNPDAQTRPAAARSPWVGAGYFQR